MVTSLLIGEFRRTLDDRYRVTIPQELLRALENSGGGILVKERPGALSLWGTTHWQERFERGVRLIESKLEAGRLEGRFDQVQRLGRLLSTRHRLIPIAGRGRLVLPEGFREFLGVEAGGELLIVGAALCIEIWQPQAWHSYLERSMPDFHQLFEELVG